MPTDGLDDAGRRRLAILTARAVFATDDPTAEQIARAFDAARDQTEDRLMRVSVVAALRDQPDVVVGALADRCRAEVAAHLEAAEAAGIDRDTALGAMRRQLHTIAYADERLGE